MLLSVHYLLSTHVFIYLSPYLLIFSSTTHQPVCLCICLSISSACMSVGLYVCLSVCLCLPVRHLSLDVSLAVCISVCPISMHCFYLFVSFCLANYLSEIIIVAQIYPFSPLFFLSFTDGSIHSY